jgi:hypothetical protein
MSERFRQYAALFVASFVGLYFEMLIVRWLAAEVRLFSYFKNLTMMAAFMGLGIGFAIAKRRKDDWRWFIPLLLLYAPVVVVVSRLTGYRALVMPEGGEYVWRAADLPVALSTAVFALTVALFFLYTTLLFVPLGQLTARFMQGLPPLRAYMVNVLGSLAGIWAFVALSYLQCPPWVWFGVGLLVILWFLRHSWRTAALNLAASAIIVAVLALTQGQTIWSPYYRVDVTPLRVDGQAVANPEETGYSLYVNQIGHMDGLNLDPAYIAAHPEYASVLRPYAAIYNLPYALVQPERVLVVGAGMGNDVAAALRHGVRRVDAVEIDQAIYELGRRMHPERPYDSPAVTVVIDDARAYLERTDQRYDLIVFGILDSQTLLSGMSSVRLDNFVYTVESLEQARARLNPGGIVVLTFDVERWWIKQRLAELVETVFGRPPIQLSMIGMPTTLYIGGYQAGAQTLAALCQEQGCTVDAPAIFDPVPLTTDDWPYLYLERRGIPTPYWVVLALVGVASWISTRKAFPTTRRLDWRFFFLGGAFLLIEFKSITELALLFGSTWLVNAIAVSAVLVMVLLANLMVARLRRIPLTALYAPLFLSLLVGLVVPFRWFLAHDGIWRTVVPTVLLGLPLFFASSIFSAALKQTEEITVAFGSNFLGSAAGGVLEYGSLAFGIRSLYIFGAVLYVASWLSRRD